MSPWLPPFFTPQTYPLPPPWYVAEAAGRAPTPPVERSLRPSAVSDADKQCAATLMSLTPPNEERSEDSESSDDALGPSQFPFVAKLKRILADSAYASIIRWNDHRRELEIRDKVRLESEIMPKFFTTHGPRAR